MGGGARRSQKCTDRSFADALQFAARATVLWQRVAVCHGWAHTGDPLHGAAGDIEPVADRGRRAGRAERGLERRVVGVHVVTPDEGVGDL